MIRGRLLLTLLAALCALTRQPCLAQNAAPAAEIDPQVDKIVHQFADFYSQKHALTVNMSARTAIKFADVNQEISAEQSFAFETPNKFALVTKADGIQGSAVVSDGKKFVTYTALSNRYQEGPAPERFVDAAINNEALMNGMFPLGVLASLYEKDPYASVMEGVLSAKLVGIEKIDGAECSHLALVQSEFSWDLWVDRGPKPLIHRLRLDAEKIVLAQFPGDPPEGLSNLKAALTVDFRDWKFDQSIPDAAFAFQPPASAKKASETDSAASAAPAPEEQEENELLGKPAPDFTLDLLDGGKLHLSDLKDKNAVILDFWASWCGPCVAALPIVTKVAAEYKSKGVDFYAINEGEDEDAVNTFLQKAKLKFDIALDQEGKVGQKYGVEGIPQTVIIDKSGAVQFVHVGYSPEIEERLPRELDLMLSGKAPARAKPNTEANVKGLKHLWDASGKFSGVAAAGEEIYALGKGNCQILDATGKAQREVTLDAHGGLLRAGHFSGGSSLLCFDPWGPEVQAFDTKGTLLWTYGGGEGIDDVWPADLKGDGQDEVIVGYNGTTGLHVLNSLGKMIWKNAKNANVWHVAAGSLSGSPEVFATSVRGDVARFDAIGNKKADIQAAGIYANLVRVAPGSNGQPCRLIVGGTVEDHEAIAALDGDGKTLWDLAVSDGKSHIDAAAPAPGRPWLALALRGGKILVVDTERGAILAESAGEAARAELAWLATPEGPVLLVTGRDSLHAYRVSAQ